MEKVLPKDLRNLVSFCLDVLGDTVRLEYGNQTFKEVERIRSSYKDLRGADEESLLKLHLYNEKRLNAYSDQVQFQIAHSFAVSLELINLCENVYRSMRLQDKPVEFASKSHKSTTFVLTAHPTEARSKACIKILTEISELLWDLAHDMPRKESYRLALKDLISIFLSIPLAKPKKPSLKDEAEYIYSSLFQKDNLKVLCQQSDLAGDVFIRTWVGGDKDGHPGVDEKAMLDSLNMSRKYLLAQIRKEIKRLSKRLSLISEPNRSILSLKKRIDGLLSQTKKLDKIENGDATHIRRFFVTLERTREMYLKVMKVKSNELNFVSSLGKIFPGFVVPLEMREDSGEIELALNDKKKQISRMLQSLYKISKRGKPSWYVQGFVISMCNRVEDVENAVKLLNRDLKSLAIPVIPLLETKAALTEAEKIITGALDIPEFKLNLERVWNRKLEVMLGYSDSAKESGAFYSRVTISRTLKKLDSFIRKKGYSPVFFHGSGGSVARGGGSVEEQISWWPASARDRFKATVQGEMIYRSFFSKQILSRKLEKISSCVGCGTKTAAKQPLILKEFADQVQKHYASKVAEDEFVDLVNNATLYPYLDQLRLGSRPSKRNKSNKSLQLRAIPWVLCWTQNRTLFPVWWGLGAAWSQLDTEKKQALKALVAENDLLNSFLKTLSYSLEKVDLSVWRFFVEESSLTRAEKDRVILNFASEFAATKKFLKQMTGKQEAIWFRPWLRESIELRSTYIYPLNILSQVAVKKGNMNLLRESVTGVASGMQTTG